MRRNAIALAPLLALTYDPRAQLPLLPVRLHLNAGLVLDGGGANSALAQLGAPEQYALGFNAYHRATFGGGLEVPLPYATPFVEYRLAVPLGTPAEGLVGLDGERHAVSGGLPATLGLGAKVTAMRDVTFLLGAELGLTREVLLGVAPTPRFNLVAGASFNVDPFARAETRVVETVRERSPTELVTRPAPAPTEKLGTVAKVAGVVLDAKTRKPVPGVMIAFATASVPPVASDAGSGRFLTHELPGGKARLVARKGGYKDATVDLVLEAGKTASVEVLLEQLAERARFLVAITSAKKPIAAVAAVEGPMTGKLEVPATATAPSALEVVPGRYLVNVSADGYLAQTREVQVSNGAEMALAFDLEKEPAKKLVVVKEKKIQILQQVHFASGKATILEDSYGLLNQVVDAIVRSGIPKIRVEGHTDNKGKKLVNLRLSQERARAVADYLEKAGIDARRLDAKGYGDSRPVAPNLTERGPRAQPPGRVHDRPGVMPMPNAKVFLGLTLGSALCALSAGCPGPAQPPVKDSSGGDGHPRAAEPRRHPLPAAAHRHWLRCGERAHPERSRPGAEAGAVQREPGDGRAAPRRRLVQGRDLRPARVHRDRDLRRRPDRQLDSDHRQLLPDREGDPSARRLPRAVLRGGQRHRGHLHRLRAERGGRRLVLQARRGREGREDERGAPLPLHLRDADLEARRRERQALVLRPRRGRVHARLEPRGEGDDPQPLDGPRDPPRGQCASRDERHALPRAARRTRRPGDARPGRDA